jgi:hypothetical protein
MSDVTDGELYTETTRGAVPADAVIAWEQADGSAAQASTVTELAASSAFSALASYSDEEAQDAVAGMIVDGEGIDTVYNDGVPSLTISCEDATDTNKGVVELATNAEAITGTDTVRATTAANVKAAASSGTLTDAGSLITATTIEGGLQEAFNGSFSVNTNATTGSTETLTLQPAHKMTMDQNCTFTFPTPATSGHYFQLWLLGGFTPTFPASVDWHGSAAPTYVNDSLYGFSTLDGGTNWLGALIASNLG